jgi:hypothetical protein
MRASRAQPVPSSRRGSPRYQPPDAALVVTCRPPVEDTAPPRDRVVGLRHSKVYPSGAAVFGLGQQGTLVRPPRERDRVFYLVTISEEDQPAGGPFDDVTTAAAHALEVSNRIRAEGGRWDGADVRVWEASGGNLGPTLDKLVTRFVDGRHVHG